MGIGVSPNNFGWVLIASFAVFLVPLLLLAVMRGAEFILPAPLRRLTGWLALIAIAGLIVAAPHIVDQMGIGLTAQIIDKTERVQVQEEGDWQEELSLNLRYDLTGEPLPPFTTPLNALMEINRVDSTQEAVTLRPTAREFDGVHPGDALEVRVLRIGTIFSLVHALDWSMWAWVSWPLAFVVSLITFLVLLTWQLRKTPFVWPLATLLVLGALAYPLLDSYGTWQRYEDSRPATGRAQATVREVTRVTRIDICGPRGGESCEYDIPQPYDIVQVDYVPSGYQDPIIGVDAVDASGTLSRYEKGGTLDVAYRPDNPRDVRIPGATRTHYWRSTVEVYTQNALIMLGLVALVMIGPAFRFIRALVRRTR